MKRLSRLLAIAALLAGVSAPAVAAPVALLTGPQDPSQILSIMNTFINSANAAYGAAGNGAVNTAITIPTVTSPVDLLQITPSATGNPGYVTLGATGTDTNISLGLLTTGNGLVYAGGTTQANASLGVTTVSSSVNQVRIGGAATGSPPTISVGGSGSDSNPNFAISTQGTGTLLLGGATTTLAGLQVAQVASRVNDVIVTPAATGSVPSIAVGGGGADTNRNLSVAGVGTGLVTLGQPVCLITGSSPQICNGQRGIVTTGTLSNPANSAFVSYTISNTSVTASSLVECTINAYSGTLHTNGQPIIDSCIPSSSGTITVVITNIDTTNALNGTVGIGFVVLN